MSRASLLRRSLDQLVVYLPLALLLVMALGSWWLLRSLPDPVVISAPATLRQGPDSTMETLTVKVFDEKGQLKRELQGDRSAHYPERKALHIEGVRLTATNDKRVRVSAQSRRAVASDDGESVNLEGDVLVVRQATERDPQIELRTQQLLTWPNQNLMRSDVPVEIRRGGDRFLGQRMSADIDRGDYQLLGRVQGLIQPRHLSR